MCCEQYMESVTLGTVESNRTICETKYWGMEYGEDTQTAT